MPPCDGDEGDWSPGEAEVVPPCDGDEGDWSPGQAEAVVGDIQARLLGMQEQMSRLKTLCFPEDPSRDWEEVILSAVRGPGCRLVKEELRKVSRHLRTIENGIDVFDRPRDPRTVNDKELYTVSTYG